MKIPTGVKCFCGRTIQTMREALPLLVEFDEEKDLIYAICKHGVVLFDRNALQKRRN